MKKIAIYARVSTDKQSCENQLIALRAVAERMGYEIVSEYLDEGISGAKSRQDRPALNAMMKAEGSEWQIGHHLSEYQLSRMHDHPRQITSVNDDLFTKSISNRGHRKNRIYS